MNYIDEIFTRLDIQHIREFLKNGEEEVNISKESYYERLERAEKKTIKLLRSIYTDNEEYEEKTRPVFRYVSVAEDVYMEIGLQCGFLLAMQIYQNTQTDN